MRGKVGGKTLREGRTEVFKLGRGGERLHLFNHGSGWIQKGGGGRIRSARKGTSVGNCTQCMEYPKGSKNSQGSSNQKGYKRKKREHAKKKPGVRTDSVQTWGNNQKAARQDLIGGTGLGLNLARTANTTWKAGTVREKLKQSIGQGTREK